jgi:transposase
MSVAVSSKSLPTIWKVPDEIAWLSKCRAILVRYDKKPENYKGLIQLALRAAMGSTALPRRLGRAVLRWLLK